MATFAHWDGEEFDKEALAAIQYEGSGRMVYTSFHKEQQLTDDMEQILYSLILSL